jgi:hypothetical protein
MILFINSSYLYSESLNSEKIILDQAMRVRRDIDIFLEDKHQDLNSKLIRDLSIFRIRVAKHPDYISRTDELNWIRHDLFLLQNLKKLLVSFVGESSLIDSLEALEVEYKVILRENNISIVKNIALP